MFVFPPEVVYVAAAVLLRTKFPVIVMPPGDVVDVRAAPPVTFPVNVMAPVAVMAPTWAMAFAPPLVEVAEMLVNALVLPSVELNVVVAVPEFVVKFLVAAATLGLTVPVKVSAAPLPVAIPTVVTVKEVVT